jgi:hypothetical protein
VGVLALPAALIALLVLLARFVVWFDIMISFGWEKTKSSRGQSSHPDDSSEYGAWERAFEASIEKNGTLLF